MTSDREKQNFVFKMWPINEEYGTTTLEMALRVNHRKGVKNTWEMYFHKLNPSGGNCTLQKASAFKFTSYLSL
jgi:hypothetical protein